MLEFCRQVEINKRSLLAEPLLGYLFQRIIIAHIFPENFENWAKCALKLKYCVVPKSAL